MTMNNAPHRAPESLASIEAAGPGGWALADILLDATAHTNPSIESESSEDMKLDLERWLDSDGYDFGPTLHTVAPAPSWLFLTQPDLPRMHHHVAAVGYTVTRHVWALSTCGLWFPIEQPIVVHDADEGETTLRYVLKANLAANVAATRGLCDHPRLGDRTS